MSADILDLSVAELLALYRQKELSPVEVARLSLERAERLNPEYNAFILISDEKTLCEQAAQSEKRWLDGAPLGPLDGIPTSIKDDVKVKGWPMRDGSKTTPAAPSAEDSPPVARLREAGALFLGKTNTPEFGHKGVTDSPLAGITRNPWDRDKTSGGSSGGAAVAAATRMGWLHLGGDGGGSVRIPASFCGIFGLKPTQGLIPRQPQTMFTTLATAGPMARTVNDAALMLNIISQPDPRDGNALQYERPDYAAGVQHRPKDLRIAYAPTINNTPVPADITALVAAAAQKLSGVGTVEEITLEIPKLVDTFNKHWMAVASWLVRQIPEEKHGDIDSSLLTWARRGAELSLDDYLEAQLERLRIIDRLKALFNDYDLILLPTMAVTAFAAGQNNACNEEGEVWKDWTPFTFPANLGKLPAASLPCGLAENGMPVGVQLLGGFMQDKLVLQTAAVLEQELAFEDWLARQKKDDGQKREVA